MSNFRTLTVERSTATGHKLSRYDGACGNVHGHNINWDIEVEVKMDEDDKSNMPVDLKDISGLVDQLDHALVLASDDPMLELDPDHEVGDIPSYPYQYESEAYGEVWVFEGDPTCEVVSQWAADELVDIDGVSTAIVTAYETDKYGIRANSFDEDEVYGVLEPQEK